MVADTYTPRLGLIEQGTGNNNNSWGDTFNASFALMVDRAIAGVGTHAVTGGTLDLSGSPPPAAASQAIDYIQNFTGTLASNQTVVMPNVSKSWLVANSTAGSFVFFVKTSAGTAVQIPQGTVKLIFCDGANGMFRADNEYIGTFSHSAQLASVQPGTIICSGQSLLRTDFPDLFAKIGATWGAVDGTHFSLPNLTDTGRFLRSASGSLTIGAYQANQNLAHSHGVTGAPSVGSLGTDNPGNHTHINFLTDNGHSHSVAALNVVGTNNTPIGGSNNFNQTGISTSTNNSNITLTNAAAGAHTHTITGTPGIGSLGTASSGGTEARPEAAVVQIGIRY